MKFLSQSALVILAALSLSACSNTFHGVGQDIERAGESIQNVTK